ncbi:MAG: copper chaperone PCu(A)C [Cohaesibacteraceae bacterium]
MTKTTLLAASAALALAIAPAAQAGDANTTMLTDDIVSTHGADTIAVGDLHLFNIFTRETPPNARSAGGFLSIYNYAEDDRLVGGSSPIAERVEIHTMSMENDVMRMRLLPDGIELPNETQVDLAPGGLHVMFIGLERPFVAGEEVPLTLTFEVNGEREFMMPVRARGEEAMDGMDHSGHADSHDHGHDHGSHN